MRFPSRTIRSRWGTGDFSQLMWVKFDSLSHTAAMTAQDEGMGDVPKWIFLVGAGGTLGVHVNQGPGGVNPIEAPWTPAVDTWYHVALVRDGSTWTVYVNGAAIGTAQNDVSIPDVDAPMTLGFAEQDYALDGALDEVMFFRSALTVGEVSSIYAAGTAGACIPDASSLEVTPAQGTVWNGNAVHLTGHLTVVGGQSAEGREITILRSRNGSEPTVVDTVITASDGTFAFSEDPPLGDLRYEAWFQGADNIMPASDTSRITVSKHSHS